MDPIGGVNNSLMQAAMEQPVNKAMMQAADMTMQAETDLMKASVGAQIGADQAAVADAGMGQLLNVQA